jgi:predicted metal-binding membrane protein
MIEGVLRRDRMVVTASLVLVTTLAWIYVIRLAADMNMGTMDMTGWRMASTGFRMIMLPARQAWTAADFLLMFAMWAVMMVGMMTPSASPLILLYARVGRQAARDGEPFAPTGWFAAGYLFAWALFALLATVAQWALEQMALLTPMMASASARFGGVVLVAAGVYQWSPLKDVCLGHCQSPLEFLQRQGGFRAQRGGSFGLGLRHGVYCVGCCWALMALLFVGGVMSLMWIAGIAIFVLIEKLAPQGRAIGRMAGISLVAAGIWLLAVSP